VVSDFHIFSEDKFGEGEKEKEKERVCFVCLAMPIVPHSDLPHYFIFDQIGEGTYGYCFSFSYAKVRVVFEKLINENLVESFVQNKRKVEIASL